LLQEAVLVVGIWVLAQKQGAVVVEQAVIVLLCLVNHQVVVRLLSLC
jgi:hypothetical protein